MKTILTLLSLFMICEGGPCFVTSDRFFFNPCPYLSPSCCQYSLLFPNSWPLAVSSAASSRLPDPFTCRRNRHNPISLFTAVVKGQAFLQTSTQTWSASASETGDSPECASEQWTSGPHVIFLEEFKKKWKCHHSYICSSLSNWQLSL